MASIPTGASRILLLAGATATGKSQVALSLAEKLDGEIISVDSMQVYRGLDIASAKPTAAERRRVPHHLLDVVEIREPFDAAQFVVRTRAAIAEIQARGRLPILCGGTGLYFQAYGAGLGAAPPSDAILRAELEARPLAELLEELERRDPDTFITIDQKNPRRVVRAVEVIRLTGKPFSAQRAAWTVAGETGAAFFALRREPADLQERIAARVEEMFARGLVAEIRELLKHGLAENKTAMQAIGCRQVVEHLRGEHTLAETVELVKIRTRQFAKRQMTWFRKYAPVEWVECAPLESAETTAWRIINKIGRPT